MEKKKILLVDDVELFLELEKTFFHRQDFDLFVARNGLQAVEIVRAERPDLVFMDLYMPVMNGDEACRIVKHDAELRGTPVIMVTQAGRETEVELCRAAGCDDILPKPIERDRFLTAAKKFVTLAERAPTRFRARLQVRYAVDPERFIADYSVNLSTGGLFLETRNLLPVNTPLIVEFILPEDDAAVRCSARVAWLNEAPALTKRVLPEGMGIQFVDLSLKDLDALRAYLRKDCLSPSW